MKFKDISLTEETKTEKHDSNATRITKDGKVVAMILRMSNDTHRLFDADEKPLSKRSFATPKAAHQHYKENFSEK